MNIRDRQILQIALPSIVSNITVPLLGMIDVAIVGHMGSAVYIGAVAVGSMVFSLVYWLFGFLRMGTSGMVAQTFGRRDFAGVTRILVRSMKVALSIALLMIVLQLPLRWLMFWLIGPTEDVVPYAETYFHIVIWGAPASLVLFSMMGWFIGMQNTKFPMIVSIMQNVVNIIASLTLVYGFGMKIEGVALGTVVAQYAGLLIALGLLVRYYGRLRVYKGTVLYTSEEGIQNSSPLVHFFIVNRDIFLRTLCLVAVNLAFTAAGARQGAVILSVNTVMMQMYLFFSYFMDGFAYAGEALGGKTYGAGNRKAFHETLRRLWVWMAIVTLFFTLLYILGGKWIFGMLTDEAEVVEASYGYIFWSWLIPAAGCVAFIWDGIFIGITATKGMLVSSFFSALVFFVIYYISYIIFPLSILNHYLWLAQIAYLAMRGLLQTFWYKRFLK